MPTVVFTLNARNRLEQRLAASFTDVRQQLQNQMSNIEQTLQQVFPQAQIAIVQNLYSGFRVRDGEHILLVEIANSNERDGLTVVKLGPPEKLQQEWNAWQNCRPHGLRHDLVLMPLQRVPEAGDTPLALVYQDAQQLIGVDETLTLERAMLDAVRLGEPDIRSVADALFQLYERLGLLLYRHSVEADLATETNFTPQMLDRKLKENLEAWEKPTGQPMAHRIAVNQITLEAPLRNHYRDPAELFSFILKQENPGEYIPRMLRGRSHGDLHGRNVLVGRVGTRVLWPAVYDYGDMRLDNWIAWDFVKMETELKIRTYAAILPFEMARHVVPFEVELFAATESARQSGQWPSEPKNPTPLERLKWLVLQIRKFAGAHLSYRGRHGFWLAEYYFLLSLYGLNGGRFPNLTSAEQLGALLSSGCAAKRFLGPQEDPS
jgi:hypothetical protein